MARSQCAGVLGVGAGDVPVCWPGSGYADECVNRNVFFRFVPFCQGYSFVVECLLSTHKARGPIPSTKRCGDK